MANNNSPLINLSGLASGLDTNSIVGQLVALRKQPATALDQKISLANTRKTGLQSAVNLLATLKSSATALSSSDLWSSTQTTQVSDSNVLTATRTSLTAPGGYSVSVSSLARAEQQKSSAGFVSAGADDVLHISVGGGTVKDVNVSSGDDVNAIATKINAVAGIGVYASVIDGLLYLSGKTTGSANTISFTSDGTTAADLGMSVSSSAANAQYTVNGGAVQTSASNTIKGAVAGLTLTLKQTGTSTVTLGEVSTSAEAVADKLQSFVDAFNAATNGVYTQVTTQPVSKAATNSEKLVGALFNNVSLQGVVSNMRGWYSHQAPGGSDSLLGKLGITTPAAGSGSLGGPPKLSFDRETFLEAYEADPNATKDLVTKYTNDASTEGMAQWALRQIDAMSGTGGVLTTAISGQDSQVKLYKDRQTRILDRASNYETNLRRQYTHLESALGALQSQNNQISSQISGLYSNNS